MSSFEDRVSHCKGELRQNSDTVIYWSVLAHRIADNPALARAIELANEHGKRCLVVASLSIHGGEITKRQTKFAVQGIAEMKEALKEKSIPFFFLAVCDDGLPDAILDRAAAVITDFGYLRHHRQQREKLGQAFDGCIEALETMVCVPVVEVSDKQEYAARTIRKKLMERLDNWLTEAKMPTLEDQTGLRLDIEESPLDWKKIDGVSDDEASEIDWLEGGSEKARARLSAFLRSDLANYADDRSDANKENVSILSPYLRFGHIAPTEIVRKARSAKADADAFIEELVVRRELACNFCHYNHNYDRLDALPDWAEETLDKHESDERDPKYGTASLENAKTGDDVWNAAMMEMKQRGYLHNHLRMFWGKYIAKAMRDPKTAHKTLLTLNNRYFLDGGDPNSFANTLWVFGLHDRAFQENDVIGKVRPMGHGALERQFDVEKWVEDRQ
ncbi:deoxyribodipyrimidine photo-lyase [Notoacmeibacter sp. MSK16QG-6]|uniref:deoxyribodipyrimidine photo-lyase n=1 Tax=Notoacmeibacter sp. MSK16QG-6 TaxID=2957982 RepID=UPI00209FB8A5|nr:deoxyribodipyrimidine photo-lyase [Notoacmeibacter sp. MSK16QG-6]MCP1197821.1 deoxyribodipyrimidine photo-lyase [Notoacmeibacter sp. MSK16QG-6]